MKIFVRWEVSYDSGHYDFDLEDVNCESEEEWGALSEEEKESRLQEALDSIPESPMKVLDKWHTK